MNLLQICIDNSLRQLFWSYIERRKCKMYKENKNSTFLSLAEIVSKNIQGIKKT